MRIEVLKCLRLRPFGIENRKHVSDAAPTVAVGFVKAANGQGGKGDGLHAPYHGKSAGGDPLVGSPDGLPGAATCARLRTVVRRRSLLAILACGAGWAVITLAIVFAGLVGLYSVVVPVSTLMAARTTVGHRTTAPRSRDWLGPRVVRRRW
jgi:hypothetical protein